MTTYEIEVGLDAFSEILNGSGTPFERWLTYYHQFQEPFDSLFKTLYMMTKEELEPVIESLSFLELYTEAVCSLEAHSLSEINQLVDRCVKTFGYYSFFRVFALVGFGHIDGVAPPSEVPFIYLGLERIKEADLTILIPHEFNHMYRFHYVQKLENVKQLTVQQLVVAEGLATVTPLVVNDLAWTESAILKLLMVSTNHYNTWKKHFATLVQQIELEWTSPLTPELMKKYFMANDIGYPPSKFGYYYGFQIVALLLKQGFSLQELTTKGTSEIIFLYQSLTARKQKGDLYLF